MEILETCSFGGLQFLTISKFSISKLNVGKKFKDQNGDLWSVEDFHMPTNVLKVQAIYSELEKNSKSRRGMIKILNEVVE